LRQRAVDFRGGNNSSPGGALPLSQADWRMSLTRRDVRLIPDPRNRNISEIR
jgi:hypothetical protein